MPQRHGLTDSPMNRLAIMKQVAFWLLVVLFFKVIGSIVFEYRNYFPANFESDFLAGRELTFKGAYRVAFYVHIVSGPVALLISAFLMFSGSRKVSGVWHRWLGKTLAAIVLLLMLPSGLVMAAHAFTGAIAAVAFMMLTVTTACCVGIAAWHARHRNFLVHERWAKRSFILLCSPLLLRLFTGATIVLDVESEWTYRFAAWGSWLIPLAGFEIRRLFISKRRSFQTTVPPANRVGLGQIK